MGEHKEHKIGTIFGQDGVSDYCLDCSKILNKLTMEREGN